MDDKQDIGIENTEDPEESEFDRLLMKFAIPGLMVLILAGWVWSFLHMGYAPTSGNERAEAERRIESNSPQARSSEQ